jgi:uncharacterized Ntn-hydrolase superfamily protein
MTYSIVARDPLTGEMGVGVQTCYFSVGSIVPWARPGIGAVATQSLVEPAYGPRCLDLMASGLDATRALAQVRSADDGRAVRQVGVIDAAGTPSAFTGEQCMDYAGHVVGDTFCVQANMMATADVWPAMAEAFEGATGALSERMFAALSAGEAAGGDARGAMSAAMVIVGPDAGVAPGAGVLLDIRVDYHERPLDELGRLLEVAKAYRSIDLAETALFGGDMEAADRHIRAALALMPEEGNVRLSLFATLLASGDEPGAGAVARELIASKSSWETVLRSALAKGLFPAPAGFDFDALLAISSAGPASPGGS